MTDRTHRLGATPLDGATRFEVWAPHAETVEICVGVDAGGERRLALGSTSGPKATWVGIADEIGHGDRYRISLDGGAPLPDPTSRRQPDGVHGSSCVVDTRRFDWTDDDWSGVTLADTVLYELHVGTFTPAGTFDAAVGQLDRLAALGVTMIEIMPINAFPGHRNWGYDGVFPFAVHEPYGGPDGLARFVDAAHRRGLGVMLDVVYNHLGPEGNVLAAFGPYFTDAYSTPWGHAVNVAGPDSDPVRRFFIENAVSWVEDFHIDGLRVDAVHAIIDPTARTMIEELVAAVHRAGERLGRHVLVTLESAANDPRMVRSIADHGWGADAVWNDDVHHALRVALTGDRHAYYAAYTGVADLATALEHRWVFRGQYSPTLRRRHGAPADDVPLDRMIVFSSNHDHAGNTPRGLRMLHEGGPTDPRRRLGAAFVLLSPFTPLIFMGREYAETAPFPYFVDHGDPELVEAVRRGRRREFADADWEGGVADPADPATFESAVIDPSIADDGPHARALALYTELLRLRREIPVLTAASASQVVRLDGLVLVLVRTLAALDATATIVHHFGTEPVPAPPPPPGRLVFDSDASAWGGDGTSDTGVLPPFSTRFWLDD
jgi:maltooligosyltrehalose trehalohydrolase